LLTLISCPQCTVPAEVTECFSLGSTDGPVSHIALSCIAGHHFRMAVDGLPVQAQDQLAVKPRPANHLRTAAWSLRAVLPERTAMPGRRPG
jgi:hypothetical protein